MSENRNTPLPELTDRDAELLSAYIDEMLTDDERADLERRLQSDAFLRQELAAMRQTVLFVANLPQLQAPRNFTLTAEMVADAPPEAAEQNAPTPKIIPLYRKRWFQTLSTLAAVFVMVVAGGLVFLTSNLPAGEPDAGFVPQSAQVASAPTQAARTAAESPAEDSTALPTQTAQPSPMQTSVAPQGDATTLNVIQSTATSLANVLAPRAAMTQASGASALMNATTLAASPQAQAEVQEEVGVGSGASPDTDGSPSAQALPPAASGAPGGNVPRTPFSVTTTSDQTAATTVLDTQALTPVVTQLESLRSVPTLADEAAPANDIAAANVAEETAEEGEFESAENDTFDMSDDDVGATSAEDSVPASEPESAVSTNSLLRNFVRRLTQWGLELLTGGFARP